MKKVAKKVRVSAKRKAATKNRKPIAKRAAGQQQPDFIGRLEGVLRIVGDIESPIEPEAWEYD
jgi:hypothetical protein